MVAKFAPYLDGDLQNWVSATYPATFGKPVWDYSRPPGQRQVGQIPGEWRQNDPFQAKMHFKDWERGRSAVTVYWVDDQGHSYPMFMKDMETILSEGHLRGDGSGPASVEGTWQVVKRGANYGIQRIGD